MTSEMNRNYFPCSGVWKGSETEMAPKMLDRHVMLSPKVQFLIQTNFVTARILSSFRLRLGEHKSLVSYTRIFETFRKNQRLSYCIAILRVGKMESGIEEFQSA